jgi:PPK2 family polyphosphate:nucleotide phosphotransferase
MAKKQKTRTHPSVRDLLRVDPRSFRLSAVDPNAIVAGPTDKEVAKSECAALEGPVSELHDRLFAAAKRAGSRRRLLILSQGMDTSGKDGAAKQIDRLLHPSFGVVGFGRPTPEEREHHFLWRYDRHVPGPGEVVLFNRSPYEQVLVVRVHSLDPWETAYEEINAWEAELVDEGTTLLKVMLHISREEQAERLLERLDDPTKHWKYEPADVDERAYWGDYQAAYQDALVNCSTSIAPWYVVPANHKWHRDWLLAHLLLETLESIPVGWPRADFDPEREKERVRRS